MGCVAPRALVETMTIYRVGDDSAPIRLLGWEVSTFGDFVPRVARLFNIPLQGHLQIFVVEQDGRFRDAVLSDRFVPNAFLSFDSTVGLVVTSTAFTANMTESQITASVKLAAEKYQRKRAVTVKA